MPTEGSEFLMLSPPFYRRAEFAAAVRTLFRSEIGEQVSGDDAAAGGKLGRSDGSAGGLRSIFPPPVGCVIP